MASSGYDSDWMPYFARFATKNAGAYFGRLVDLLEARANGEAARVQVNDGDEIDPINDAVDFRLQYGAPELFQSLGEFHSPDPISSLQSLHADYHLDAAKLKELCLQVYTADDVPSLTTRLESAPLAPEWIDILAVIAYVRQHLTTLTYLVSTYPAPSQPSFSRFGHYDHHHSTYRLLSFSASPEAFQTRLLLLRMWTPIITHSIQSHTSPRSPGCWAHLHRRPEGTGPAAWEGREPDYWTLRQVLFELLCDWRSTNTSSDTSTRDLRSSEAFTTAMFPFLEALRDVCDVYPDASTLAELLTTLSGRIYGFEEYTPALLDLDIARALITGYIPPDGYIGEQAISILLPLAAVSESNPDRLEVMKLAVQAGCNVNARMEDTQWPGYGDWMRYSKWQRGTALHVAADRGDMEMVECLLSLGARVDVWWPRGVGAAEVARRAGQEAVAGRIEREVEMRREREGAEQEG